MSAYSLEIQFAEGSRQPGVLAGVVRIEAFEAKTCRKLVLLRVCLETEEVGDAEDLVAGKRPHETVVTKWAEWQPGQAYEYPFEFASHGIGGSGGACNWFVRPVVHLTGEFEPDMPTGWISPEAPSPISVAATAAAEDEPIIIPIPDSVETRDEVLEAGVPASTAADSGVLPASSAKSIDLIDGLAFSIKFDQLETVFSEGEQITGKLVVEVDRDYEVEWLGLYYQWRTDAAGDTKGVPVDIALAEDVRWQADGLYEYPFKFSVTDLSLGREVPAGAAWFLWPEVDTKPAVPVVREEGEVGFSIVSEVGVPEDLPNRSYWVARVSRELGAKSEKDGSIDSKTMVAVWAALGFLAGVLLSGFIGVSACPGQLGSGLFVAVLGAAAGWYWQKFKQRHG